MRQPALPTLGTLLLFLSLSASVAAQETVESAPSVFFDCQGMYCWDYDHTRREIPYVNWVRDRQDADVHVLITSLRTGGGGYSYTLEFIGLRTFAGRSDTLGFISDATDTEDEIRTEMVRVVRLGLVPYLVASPVGQRLDVTYQAPEAGAAPAAATAADDPWNFWSFRISGNGSANGQSQQRYWSGYAYLSASRVTDDLKLDFSLNASGSRSEYDYVDSTIPIDTTYVSTRESFGADALIARSISSHWSAGLRGGADRSTRLNQDLALRAGPAIEYNIYPYSESTRRSITFEYSVGVAAFRYTDTTIFGKTAEILPEHRLRAGVGVTQPWGSIFTTVYGSQYLHDLTKYNVGVGGSTSVRLFRGLSFNIYGDIARVKDQLYIARAGLTTEEVLLEQRTRGTDYQYYVGVGLSYRFGSKFANIVNPRMGGGGGGMVIMM